MALLNAGQRRALNADELASFSGTPVTVTVAGPKVLYRLLGTWRDSRTGKKGRNNPMGVFWFERSVVDLLKEEFLDHMEFELAGQRPRPGTSHVTAMIRDGLAVSQEWNSFDSLIEMRLDKGDQVEAWSGVTEWQVAYQTKPDGRILAGGFVQYVVHGVHTIPQTVFRRRSLVQIFEGFSANLNQFA